MSGHQPPAKQSSIHRPLRQCNSRCSDCEDRVFSIGHSVTKKQVCRESYQKVVALLPGPKELSRYMRRPRRRLDRECVPNKASISRPPCLNIYKGCAVAGEDKAKQNSKGALTWLIISHPRLCTACGRRTRHAGCLTKLSKRRSREKTYSIYSTKSHLISFNSSILTPDTYPPTLSLSSRNLSLAQGQPDKPKLLSKGAGWPRSSESTGLDFFMPFQQEESLFGLNIRHRDF
ncbi:hypothetical protein BDP55DRAFT_172061 [Colletotrichum godetiae]|uniref:Uncharacterized protein n=1 Tax=Colletotrichum godetiae TaxID=1209918 RepID=A0AAJ0ALS1_9PEZI|nr:uncharacterized protein BDP55DRAFT_172061 [Colletotrichum godetiae]KAK1674758.1 hypothetical protein BDP55DRAFT_172061 [Colletotrichum godetiae]